MSNKMEAHRNNMTIFNIDFMYTIANSCNCQLFTVLITNALYATIPNQYCAGPWAQLSNLVAKKCFGDPTEDDIPQSL